jgi:hypothetical protein
MGLGISDILGASYGHQRRGGQTGADQGSGIGNRKGVTIEEHQQVVIAGVLRDLKRQVIQLARVIAALDDHVVEEPPV